jgi:hypothetical protein
MPTLRTWSGIGLFLAAVVLAPCLYAQAPPDAVTPPAPTPSVAPTATAVIDPPGSMPGPSPVVNPPPAPPSSGAQNPPVSGAPGVPSPPPGWQTSNTAWFDRYTVARERLLAGDFTTARDLFIALTRTATNPADEVIARELAELAKDWSARDLVFIRRTDLGESAMAAKAAGERSSDEIAILYTNAVIYGLGTGLWFDFQTKPDSAAEAILPALTLGGAAAGAVAIVDSKRRFRYGVPQSIVSGMYIGLGEGLVLTLWNQSRVARRDEWSSAQAATVVWGFATAGVAAGAIVGSVGGTTPGRASFVGSAAMWTGAVSAMVTADLAGVGDQQDDAAYLASVIGLNAGAVLGILAAGPVSPSIARVRFLDLGAVAGGLVLGGLYFSAAENSDGRGLAAMTGLGIAGGLTTAWFATRKMEPDRLSSESAPANVLSRASLSLTPTMGGAAVGLRSTF